MAPLGAVVAGALAVGLLAPPATSVAGARHVHGLVRVNQQGYLRDEPKQARLMTDAPAHGARYRVRSAGGRVVLRGRVPARSTGSWNARWPAVYRLDLSALHQAGRYRIVVSGGVAARSPWFRVRSAGSVFGTLLDAGVLLRPQPARRRRTSSPGRSTGRPSHLLDRRASIYRWPHMQPGSDLITDRHLHRDRWPGERRGRLVRRRRLPEVHPLHGVRRRAAVHQRPAARAPYAGSPARRGEVRTALARARCGARAPTGS